mmetsp:Transcript_6052/g.6914  ORF Transcript_6052/g.6914 Transcript_6052/m.6914 type:complete len:430 (-) Transcript_6052:239-1528(-)
MSAKEAKPTLGGARLKTRKRNIAVPLDPASFADAVVQIFVDASEGQSVEADLEAGVKALEAAELDFSRYGDTLFEVLFTGGRLSTGGTATEDGLRLETHVLGCEANRESISPYISAIQQILRRRPFLIKNLENILRRLMQQLEHHTDTDRDKVAVATSMSFDMKLGLPPENVFNVLLNDSMVMKGTVLSFITMFMKDHLVNSTLEELMALLRRGKVHDLMMFFPMQKRTQEAFKAHFTEAGLSQVVNYYENKLRESRMTELKAQLTEHMSDEEDEAAAKEKAVKLVKDQIQANEIKDTDLVKLVWGAIMDSIQWSGKNQQQISNAACRQVNKWAKEVLTLSTKTKKAQAELIIAVQIFCYENNNLMKTFPDIVRVLYNVDVLEEETIIFWYKKGSHNKGRQVFLESMAPFIKWLEEADSETDDEDEDEA